MSVPSAGSPASTELGPASTSQPSVISVRIAPPTREVASKRRTLCPRCTNRNAAVNPVMPAPSTAIDLEDGAATNVHSQQDTDVRRLVAALISIASQIPQGSPYTEFWRGA